MAVIFRARPVESALADGLEQRFQDQDTID
jgi:hypothetical protein